MKPILKWLARLYPSSWRKRYGAEYEALLDDSKPRVRDAFDVIRGATTMHLTGRSFVRIVLPCALAGGLLAVATSFALPVLYTSGAMVVVESSPLVPSPADGLATPAGAASQGPQILDLVRVTFADREAMAGIIRKYNLYPAERAKMPMDSVVDKMRSAIFIRNAPRSSLDNEFQQAEERWPWNDPQLMEGRKNLTAAFTVEFRYPDPRIAQWVDASLLTLLTRANLRLSESAAAAGHPRPPENIWVMDPPSLPQARSIPKRGLFGAGGLLAGLISGLVAATMAGRRRFAVSNG